LKSSAARIPVAAAAYGIGFLIVPVAKAPALPRPFVASCRAVMVFEMVVGVAGAGLHIEANLRHSAMTTVRDRFVFGAPAFAPLLFASIALLALVGLWACGSSLVEEQPSAPLTTS
jgi:hypothetical protein